MKIILNEKMCKNRYALLFDKALLLIRLPFYKSEVDEAKYNYYETKITAFIKQTQKDIKKTDKFI